MLVIPLCYSWKFICFIFNYNIYRYILEANFHNTLMWWVAISMI